MMENQNNISSNVDEKLKKLKVEGIKNVSFLSFSISKNSRHLSICGWFNGKGQNCGKHQWQSGDFY